LIAHQSERSNPRRQGAKRVSRKSRIGRASSHTASSGNGSADHRARQRHSNILSHAPFLRTEKRATPPARPFVVNCNAPVQRGAAHSGATGELREPSSAPCAHAPQSRTGADPYPEIGRAHV